MLSHALLRLCACAVLCTAVMGTITTDDAEYICSVSKGHASMAAFASLLDSMDVEYERLGFRNDHTIFMVKVDAGEADLLRALPYVRHIKKDAVVKAQCAVDATYSSSQEGVHATNWGVRRVTTPSDVSSGAVFPVGVRGNGVVVYVLDSGVYCAHPLLEGRCTVEKSFGSGAYTTQDDNGHGTHVAGVVAAQRYGVATGASIVSMKILNSEGQGLLSGIVRALSYINGQRGPRQTVINLSVSAEAEPLLRDAVDNMVESGYTVVVGAGNDGVDACNVDPAGSRTAITVGATDYNDRIAGFSNEGSCIDILAPGVNIISIPPGNTQMVIANGTSQAAPHVSGLAALYLQQNPDATGNQFKAALLASSRRVRGDMGAKLPTTTNIVAYMTCEVAPLVATPAPSSSDSFPVLLVAIIVGCAVLLVAIVAVACYCCRKSKKDKSNEPANHAPPRQQPQPQHHHHHHHHHQHQQQQHRQQPHRQPPPSAPQPQQAGPVMQPIPWDK